MNKSDAWKTWGIIIGLLLFTGLASAAWLWFSSQEDSQSESQVAEVERETELITVRMGDYVLGDELLGIDIISKEIEGTQINPWLVVAGAAGIVTVFVGAIGMFLMVITVFTSRQVSKVYSNESFQSAQVDLSQRDAQSQKEKQENRPQAISPGPQRRLRWSVLTSSILVLILVWITGLVFGVAFFGDTMWEFAGVSVSAVALVNLVLVVISIVVLALTIRAREPEDLDLGKTDNNPVNWSYVWVILSGALIFGLGAGLAIAMTSISAG